MFKNRFNVNITVGAFDPLDEAMEERILDTNAGKQLS